MKRYVVFAISLILTTITTGSGCSEGDSKFTRYTRYEVIELDGKGDIDVITLFDSVHSLDYSEYVRLGYSFVMKLHLEASIKGDEWQWLATAHFRQELPLKSMLEMFNIPLTREEALAQGFINAGSGKFGPVMELKNEKNFIRVSYPGNGQVLVDHARIAAKKGGEKILHVMEYSSTSSERGKEKLKQIMTIKARALTAETDFFEIGRTTEEKLTLYEDYIFEVTRKILTEHPDYYYGWVDYGLWVYDFEDNLDKAVFNIRKAISLNETIPFAYSALHSIYYLDNKSEYIERILSNAESKLSNQDLFNYYYNVVSTMHGLARSDYAWEIFHEMSCRFKGEEFKDRLKYLKNILEGKPNIKKREWLPPDDQ